ncbi:zinc finger and BTB domain-containing protein 49 [Elysia marginata]|uniref:Zinc finger and BTB domain-containing protein 49 n=1 Tax=Elysia marginata TaxID=1093978 RepID=A0AAV4EGN7_9GAST|nr:zinc finger and BTB domain-containing protein 49 [Elysia marginata]
MERKKRRKYNRKSWNTHISLEVIKQYLLNGAYPHGSTPSDKRSVRKRSESFKLDNNVLYYVVKPKQVEGELPDPNPRENIKNLRKAIFSVKDQLSVTSAVHLQGNGGNHMGTERTLTALSSKYYWVGMAATVRKVLRNCVVCLANRPAVSILTTDLEDGTPFSQSWDSEAPLLLSKGAGAAEEKKSKIFAAKEIDNDSKRNVFTEDEGQFVVTNELTEPEEIDSDLDFDQESAVPDKIFDPKIDIHRARRFWHKVELQIFGPFPFKRSHAKFVVAALDSYSRWPEVQPLEKFDEKTVSRFCLKLIARYGAMEHLILLENDVSAKKPLDASGISQNLQACAVNVSKEDSNPMDESWCNLFKSVERFVNVYIQEWPDCLDLCLLPLRNTVSQLTEFTPAFLLMGREPSFPDVILPRNQSVNTEVSLSTEQIHQAADDAMSIYHGCSVPDIKHVIDPSDSIPIKTLETKESAPENIPDMELVRKSSRKTKKSTWSTDQEDKVEKTLAENGSKVSRHVGSDDTPGSCNSVTQDLMPVEEDDDLVEKYKVLDSLNTDKLYWRGMHADVRAFVTACPGCRFGETKKKRKTAVKQLRWLKAAAPIDEEDSDAEASSGDMSYDDLWMYIKKGATPDFLSRSALLVFRKKAKNFKIEKGTLYYYPPSDGKKKPRKVLRTEEEKQEVLARTHLGSGDEHLVESIMKDKLRESVFWYGMFSDLKNFVASCSQCQTSEQSGLLGGEADKQETAVEEKVKLFQDYFAGKNITQPQECLDSLFPPKATLESNGDCEAEALDTAQAVSPDESDELMNEELPQESSSQKELDVPVKEPHSLNTNCEKVLPEKEESLKADLADAGDISEMKHLCQHNKDENEVGEAIEVEPSNTDTSFQLTTSYVEKTRATSKLTKSPLSVPKLPRTRKRCDICFEVILGENNFKAHMYKHTGVKPFECNLCHKYFTNIRGLRLHLRKHTGHRPFLCNICGRGFPRSASLRYHIKTHERGNNSLITCDVCHRTFTTMNRLIKHKGFKHPAQAPVYSCEQCGKCFTAKRSLKRHEEVHKGIRKYQCQYCKRKFFRKEYLDYHLVSHANEDPSILENVKFRNKSKRPLPSSLKKKRFSEGLLTLTYPSGADMVANQETFGQVVEVQVPEGWPQLQREQTLVYELGPDETLVPTSVSQEGGSTAAMVVMDVPPAVSGAAGMEVRHIFLPSQEDVLQHGQQQQQLSHLPEVQTNMPLPSSDQETQQVHHGAGQIHQQSVENRSESKIKLSHDIIIDSLQQQQQQQQYHNEQQQVQNQGNFGGHAVVKLTHEDLVSLQQQLPSSNLDHYQHHLQQPQSQIGTGSTSGQEDSHKSIEIFLPSGTTRTLTLPLGSVEGHQVITSVGDVAGDESTTVQYQVECLSGETLTEADYDAIRMLAQASLAGGSQHLTH